MKLERSRLCISSLPQLMQSDQFSWFVNPRTNDQLLFSLPQLLCDFQLILKKFKMVSVFTQPDVNTWEVGRTRDKRRKSRREAEWFPAYRVRYLKQFLSTLSVLSFPQIARLKARNNFPAGAGQVVWTTPFFFDLNLTHIWPDKYIHYVTFQ